MAGRRRSCHGTRPDQEKPPDSLLPFCHGRHQPRDGPPCGQLVNNTKVSETATFGYVWPNPIEGSPRTRDTPTETAHTPKCLCIHISRALSARSCGLGILFFGLPAGIVISHPSDSRLWFPMQTVAGQGRFAVPRPRPNKSSDVDAPVSDKAVYAMYIDFHGHSRPPH